LVISEAQLETAYTFVCVFFPNSLPFSWKIMFYFILNCSFWYCVCSRCASEWQEYQTARQKVIEVMNEAEKKLSEFSVAKAASSHEAEEKLQTHKVRR